MRDFEVVDVFKHKTRLCVVVQMHMMSMADFCTGYVQTLKKNYGRSYNDFISEIDADELTYGGELSHLKDERIPNGLWFFGFDSAHIWNDENPETKTYASVKERTIKMADEMIKKRI